jgi:hypothetical protein
MSSLVLCKVFLLGNENDLIRAAGVYHRPQELQGFSYRKDRIIVPGTTIQVGPGAQGSALTSETELYCELNQSRIIAG